MYFGSVKFFRHLILTVVFGWIGIATVLAVYFGIKCHSLSENGTEGSEGQTDMTGIEEYMADMNSKGISSEDILNYIRENDNKAFQNVVSDAISVPAMGTAAETEMPSESETAALSETVTEPDFEEPVTDEPEQPANTEAPVSTEQIVTTAPPAVTEQKQESKPTNSDQSNTYNDMYADGVSLMSDSRSVYLTFDNCPSDNIYDIITILKRQNAVATFFISDGELYSYDDQLLWITETGSGLGVLAGVNKSYSTADAYFRDFSSIFNSIYNITGQKPQVCRIPGSMNVSSEVLSEIKAELERRGFEICEGNVLADDENSETWQDLYDSITGGVYRNYVAGTSSVVRLSCGDDDYTTVLTAEDIICDLIQDGYTFRAIR